MLKVRMSELAFFVGLLSISTYPLKAREAENTVHHAEQIHSSEEVHFGPDPGRGQVHIQSDAADQVHFGPDPGDQVHFGPDPGDQVHFGPDPGSQHSK